MDDIPIDGLGRKHWVNTLRCNHTGSFYNEFNRTSGLPGTCWISKYSLQFYQIIAVGECAIIDFVEGIEPFSYCATDIIPISHLRQRMSEWIPHIYPDLGWINMRNMRLIFGTFRRPCDRVATSFKH